MSETSAHKASAERGSPCPGAAQPGSPWREMTWAEYYADVRERAARHGVEVIWVNPPEVRSAPKAEPHAAATVVATCAR